MTPIGTPFTHPEDFMTTDGSIAIDGKKVDNPEDYKGKPLAGGPTDTGTSS